MGTPLSAAPDASWVRSDYRPGDFKLVYGGDAADIVVSPVDFQVVQIAASGLAADIERVTGKKPVLRTQADGLTGHVVLVGTLGRSPVIDALVRDRKLDVSAVRGQWESFLIATVAEPLPGVSMGLVIAGSDRRGTAYGVYELSEAIGVSPWYWWADVAPDRRENLIVSAGTRRSGPPSVQYRGIFLNDEDWGLQPWAAKTFEPETGDIGPKTYARICELLLRLKANTLWPAMHSCTKAFNIYTQNKIVADDYAIVMGSSHCEPMLRNNVTEWTGPPADFNFIKNPEGVTKYWEQRLAENGRFDNIYTLGMRGIHDGPMQGPTNAPQHVQTLERIFGVQRDLLAKYVAPDVTKIPQVFCPYKEVLAYYLNGLKVPEDVTIVFPDDNFGYIRYFPSAEEQQRRRGGFGVYYHISYLGSPLSYLWLETTPPALIWEEMSKAYDHGMRKLWIVNVGDLKPGEIGMEFFLQMAWDITKWRRDNLPDFLKQWARREFGAEHAAEIAAVMDEYYRLGYARKPEHLQWYLPNEQPQPSALTAIDYGDEVQARLDAYGDTVARANRLYAAMPENHKDAFYELVTYPVRGAALANERFFSAEKTVLYAAQGRASASDWARRAADADAQMKTETAFFNEQVAGGKWRRMMSIEPSSNQWRSLRPAPWSPPTVSVEAPAAAGLGVAIEGRREPVREGEKDAALPTLNVFTRDARFIDVFNTGRAPAEWSAKASHDWIRISQAAGNLRDDARFRVSIDWDKAPRGEHVAGTVVITGAGATRIVNVPVFNPESPRPPQVAGFVESGGVVAIEAEHYASKTDRGGASWQVIPGLGRTDDAVAVFPTTTSSVEPAKVVTDAPVLEYPAYLFTTGKVAVTCYLVPTHPLKFGQGLRYAVGFDHGTPQVVIVKTEVQTPAWSRNVLNATTTASTTLEVAAAGPHVLRIYMIDPGVVLDKIVIDAGGARPSYLGPKETKVATSIKE